MVKILVTGGLGFIGKNLVETLLKNKKNEVYVVDIAMIKKEIPSGIKGVFNDVYCFVRENIEVDEIYHLGMPSSSPMYKEKPELVGEVVDEMIVLLEYTKKVDARLLLVSTSSIYNGNRPPFREDMKIHVTDYYTEARYFCERLCELYNKLHGVQTVAVRLFSVYGKGDIEKGKYANIITQFDKCAKENKPLVIYGDGEQTRDFINVKEVVRGLLKAIEKCGYFYDVFNIGTEKSFSFNEIAEAIIKKNKSNSTIIHIKNPIKNYIKHTRADMTKSRYDELGFIGDY